VITVFFSSFFFLFPFIYSIFTYLVSKNNLEIISFFLCLNFLDLHLIVFSFTRVLI
jgi:hypothetical protein